jgi:nucleotide-binding universal stress UspA family protein
MKILLAVDGSEHAQKGVLWVIKHAGAYNEAPQIELVNVHAPLPYHERVRSVIGSNQVERYYREEGVCAIEAAKRALDGARLRYAAHLLVGSVAESIGEHALATHCDFIVIASRGMGAAANLLLGSVAAKLVHISPVPVLVVR